MSARFSIVSDPSAPPRQPRRWEAPPRGGLIGRRDDNDWVLADEDRYVSLVHAEVRCRDGVWWLRDHSSNGTYINGAHAPLGREREHRLRDGDRLRIGKYEIEVALDGAESAQEPDIDVKALLAGRRDAQPGDGTSGRRKLEAQRGIGEHEFLPGLVQLCKGAGIDLQALPPEARASALNQAGQLLREALIGFADLVRTRADFANEFGVVSGARRQDATSPLVQIAAVEQLLAMLLAGQGPGQVRAIDEFRSQFARTRAHELALAAAMRDAVTTLLQKLDPQDLEERAGQRGRAGAPDAHAQAQLWQRYVETYRSVAQSAEAGLPAAFLVAFARAYEAIVAGGEIRRERDEE